MTALALMASLTLIRVQKVAPPTAGRPNPPSRRDDRTRVHREQHMVRFRNRIAMENVGPLAGGRVARLPRWPSGRPGRLVWMPIRWLGLVLSDALNPATPRPLSDPEEPRARSALRKPQVSGPFGFGSGGRI